MKRFIWGVKNAGEPRVLVSVILDSMRRTIENNEDGDSVVMVVVVMWLHFVARVCYFTAHILSMRTICRCLPACGHGGGKYHCRIMRTD